MTILAIDTSAKAASACLAQEDKIIGEFFIDTSLTHSQTLIPMIEQLAKNAQVSLDELDAIAVNAGPGSFTGVRIGVAAAKGLAFAHDLPCVSVSTLKSMAYNALPDARRFITPCFGSVTERLSACVMTGLWSSVICRAICHAVKVKELL